jgi:hypothetical protein
MSSVEREAPPERHDFAGHVLVGKVEAAEPLALEERAPRVIVEVDAAPALGRGAAVNLTTFADNLPAPCSDAKSFRGERPAKRQETTCWPSRSPAAPPTGTPSTQRPSTATAALTDTAIASTSLRARTRNRMPRHPTGAVGGAQRS